jgi:hypothetical protein
MSTIYQIELTEETVDKIIEALVFLELGAATTRSRSAAAHAQANFKGALNEGEIVQLEEEPDEYSHEEEK